MLLRYNKDECPSSTSRKEVYRCTFNYFKNKSGTMEYHGHCENPFFPTYYWERNQHYYRIKRIVDQLIDISIFLSQFNSDANALYPCWDWRFSVFRNFPLKCNNSVKVGSNYLRLAPCCPRQNDYLPPRHLSTFSIYHYFGFVSVDFDILCA